MVTWKGSREGGLVLIGITESRESFLVMGIARRVGGGEVSGLESMSNRPSADTRWVK